MYDALLTFGLDTAATAIHEAGHAAGARLYGYCPAAIAIRTDQSGLFGERCAGSIHVRSMQASNSSVDLWRNAVIIAMGPVAEFKFLGEVAPGSHEREAVEELLNFSKHGGFDSFDSDSQKLASYAQRIYGTLDPEETLIHFAHGATREAARLLDANWPAVIRLAESFIQMTALMDTIKPQPLNWETQETLHEHLRKYQKEVSSGAADSGDETPSGMDRIPQTAIAR